MDIANQIELSGHVENGMIVLDGGASLPEGAAVTVLVPAPAALGTSPLPTTELICEPGKLPYVRGGIPGTLHLTNDMIAQIFEEEDIAMMKGMFVDPS